MFANIYLSKCNEETRKIITIYMMIMYENSDDFSCPKNDFFPIIENIKLTNYRANTIFYLLYFAFTYNKDLNKLAINNNIDLNNKSSIIVPFKVLETMPKYMNTLNSDKEHFFRDYIEMIFSERNISALSLLKAYTDFDKQISIERIIVNICNDGLFKNIKWKPIAKAFKIDEIYEDIKELAEQKEKDDPSNITIKSKDIITTPYGVNLTNINYTYNPLIGRDIEYRRMCAQLMDDEKSLIIHGKPGVGKTSLVRGLAYEIWQGVAPKPLQDKQIIEVSSAEIIRDCRYVGMTQERTLQLIESLLDKNCILFIDEIHTLIGLGKGDKTNDSVENILKPYLGDGRIKIMGATTTDEYNIILEDGAFARRFNALEITEPTNEEIFEILKTYIERKKLEGIKYDKDSIDKLLNIIIEYSHRQGNAMIGKKLYNPDLALAIIRNGYNFAKLEDTKILELEHIIEGLESMDYFSNPAKKEFKEKVMTLKRKEPKLKLLR